MSPDPRVQPHTIVALEELVYFHTWLPGGRNWWITVLSSFLMGAGFVLIAIAYR